VNAPPALLLLGPTGSGKTPLGDWLDRHGLAGRRCHHFDFGAQLRTVAAPVPPAGFSAAEVGFVRAVLDRGALLEDKDFPLAEKLLETFLSARQIRPADWVVLNGLPRQAGQAAALGSGLAIQYVVELRCTAATVAERLARDSGGDRRGRRDDGTDLIRRKLVLYEDRTRPLVEYYRQQGSGIVGLDIEVATTAAEAAQRVEVAFGAWLTEGRATTG